MRKVYGLLLVVAILFSASLLWPQEAYAASPGDCNGDGAVNAADITAVVLEIHDGDGRKVARVGNGTFAGTDGCDADGNGRINRKDIRATINVIFGS